MTRPTLQHRLEYGLARAMESAVGRLTPAAAARIGGIAGRLAGSPLGIRREIVRENLRRAFPEADEHWIARITREAYAHLGREAAAMIRLASTDPAGVSGMVEIPDEDWAGFKGSLAEGRGAIVATGHYGNWEVAAAAVAARGVPIVAIVKRQNNPLVDARLEEARRALGVETVEMGDAPRRIPRALMRGKAVGIVADQDARASGEWIPFFGVPASTHVGPAVFALRLGSPLFAVTARRMADGRYRVTARRVEARPTGDLEADVIRVTTALARDLEDEIRIDPTQYFWFHKRWKTPPPEEPLRGETGTTSHSAQGKDLP
ncbi:MAG: lysophospholipid acyltransferase family protein [Gemmatimonadota bacterium]